MSSRAFDAAYFRLARELVVTLHPLNAETARITTSDVSARGKYSGDLSLDPRAKEQKATALIVNARDAIWWPLLADPPRGFAWRGCFVRLWVWGVKNLGSACKTG
jgi:hypothetical protein